MLQVLAKYYHTLKHLQWVQAKHQLLHHLPGGGQRAMQPAGPLPAIEAQQALQASIPQPKRYLGNLRFEFLNLSHQFATDIDWNHSQYGKLWTYNLNYFEYLCQEGLSAEDGLQLIRSFVKQEADILDGLEPFPISLRLINWIKFLLKHNIQDAVIQQSMWLQLNHLSRHPEYRLLGNHLLENAYGLCFGAVYFGEERIFRQAVQLLREQLTEQVLADGAHFELSPMYHQLMLYRLLDVIDLLKNNRPEDESLLVFLEQKAALMLGWMQQMTFANGQMPLLNDASPGIAPTASELLQCGKQLGIEPEKQPLKASGYRKVSRPDCEMICDVGQIGPDYIPGHAHSDTFNFVLAHKGQPVIVDVGVSTYEKNARRQWERSTAAHNTVMVDGVDQSEVWGGFRVAQRARIISLQESPEQIKASHDGYRRMGIIHSRCFRFEENSIEIVDQLDHPKEAKAFLHFHPTQVVRQEGSDLVGSFGRVEIRNASKIELESYQRAMGFNKTAEATKVVIHFIQQVHTKFLLS
ncbi:MAG: alginate lyase family protein [Bacteroidota bacterium]